MEPTGRGGNLIPRRKSAFDRSPRAKLVSRGSLNLVTAKKKGILYRKKVEKWPHWTRKVGKEQQRWNHLLAES